ncbi:MAG: hypothetical protein SAK29_25600, partial [Scytonema sp. PMC 1069.18]|nr:hypothetical protein [Scytonema sp. PMC 1069.18]
YTLYFISFQDSFVAPSAQFIKRMVEFSQKRPIGTNIARYSIFISIFGMRKRLLFFVVRATQAVSRKEAKTPAPLDGEYVF